MWVESVVCNISVVFSVVFLRHSVHLCSSTDTAITDKRQKFHGSRTVAVE